MYRKGKDLFTIYLKHIYARQRQGDLIGWLTMSVRARANYWSIDDVNFPFEICSSSQSTPRCVSNGGQMPFFISFQRSSLRFGRSAVADLWWPKNFMWFSSINHRVLKWWRKSDTPIAEKNNRWVIRKGSASMSI